MTHLHTHHRRWKVLWLLLLCVTLSSFAAPVIVHPSTQPGFNGQIAYVDRGDIYLLDLALGTTSQLTFDGKVGADVPENTHAIAWSSDGTQLAFTSSRSGSADIYSLHVETGDIAQITNDPAPEFAPTFAPDDSIVFVRSLDAWEGNGGDAARLIIRHNSTGTEDTIYDLGPTCNPTRISFTSMNQYALAIDCRFTVDITLIDGSQESQLGGFVSNLCSAPPSIGRDYYAKDAEWSHHRGLLAFIGADCAVPEQDNWSDALHILDLSQANPVARKIYAGGTEELSSLSWGSDDQALVFATSIGLWIISAQGGSPQQISAVGDSPAWRPQPTPLLPTVTSTPLPPTVTSTSTATRLPNPPTVTSIPTSLPLTPTTTQQADPARPLEVAVSPIAQRFEPDKVKDKTSIGIDTGLYDCVPTSLAIALQSMEASGIISNTTTDYPSIRRAFRAKAPNVYTGMDPMLISTLTPELSGGAIRADLFYIESAHWQEVLTRELQANHPMIAIIIDWHKLAGAWAGHEAHAILIYGLHDGNVLYVDPWDGQRYAMTTTQFAAAWDDQPPVGNDDKFIAFIFKKQ